MKHWIWLPINSKEIIATDGPDAVGGIGCARSINEDSYQMQKLFRAAFKSPNIDHCARVCHAPTVAGLIEILRYRWNDQFD